jgi:phosphoglycolate phosphatase
MKQRFKNTMDTIKAWLAKLSFSTGVVVLVFCVLFYLLSFVQALLPLSAEVKSVLFIVFFGMAKTAQYTGLAIVGVKGWQRIKSWFKRKRELHEE